MRTVLKSTNNHAPGVEAVAAWLLASGESMPETDRNQSPAKARTRAATALENAIALHSPYAGERELVQAAGISTTALWDWKTKGFSAKNKKLWKLAAILGVDAKALIRGEIVRVAKPTEAKESDLFTEIQPFIGTPKEKLIRQYLEALKTSG